MNSYRYKQKPTRRWWKNLAITFVVSLIAAFGLFFVAYRAYTQNLRPVMAIARPITVEVREGAGIREVAEGLEQEKVIRSAWAFEIYMRTSRLADDVIAGTYSLLPSQSAQQIAQKITGGDSQDEFITILPVKRLDEIRSLLINEGFAASEVDAALDPAQYRSHPALADKPREASLEGYLYPETFTKTSTSTAKDIISRSLDEMNKRLTNGVRNGILQQGITVHEGIILASMLELEVGDKDQTKDLEDKRKVAQVFFRRLRDNIALQSNATARYGAIVEGREQQYRNTESASFLFQTPYNTYLNKGLPPSPMSNVSNNALIAVSNPADTDYLYFFSADNRENYFSNTLEEHERLINIHCRERCSIPR
jgi:UPF0755 protein